MNIKQMCDESYETAVEHGWWPAGQAPNIPEKIALMHSELSEALESIRNGDPPRLLYHTGGQGPPTGVYDYSTASQYPNVHGGPPKPEGFPSELADVLIRIGDLCGYLGIDLEGAVRAKMAYNKTRPFRHGGKTC